MSTTDRLFTPAGGVRPIMDDAVRPSPVTPSRGPRRDRRRRNQLGAAMLALVAGVGVIASLVKSLETDGVQPIALPPAVVQATLRLEGAVVRGAEVVVRTAKPGVSRYGMPMSVSLTAYCLKGLTRRDNYVRQGIVAADPRVFPLGRYLELYLGKTYLGRFLIDDTGGAIKGNRLDVWTPTCREARIFGRQKGTAVLVPRPRGARSDTLLTGRLAGVMR